ncbi:STE20-related kinase adapter protein alpha isoform X1 [Dermacentor andersoni]|uniref:STE20-related kinase adapter protein alpha isoform X1 n=2 Tax=Dermacentor andersoni TaxID=34620 RepID=UPI0021552BB1|nr:STE20-related kinase adapter protein alpha-like isoform X1 [Dermacentor andersoni]XP_050034630.1 STE20-related kinase adapter protein alpha-like isoform X1 [Dermacentor andersoni]
MSCLFNCRCRSSRNEVASVEDNHTNDESLYQHLSEASNFSEAIPLMQKDPDMIKYEASVDNYELLSVIGRGLYSTAVVSLVKHIPSGHRLAVKRTNLEAWSGTFEQVQHEIFVVRQLRHENVIPYFCTLVKGNELWAVMPLLTYGSVRDILNTHFPSGLPEHAVSFILKDLVIALHYIHTRGYIHRSVKASHLLLSSKGKVMLSGFRYCCSVIESGRWRPKIHAFPRHAIQNLSWLGPEVLEQNLMGYNFKSDIYSVGVTALELANGVAPFADMAPTQVLLAKIQGCVPKLSSTGVCDGPTHKPSSSQDMCKAGGESTSKANFFGNEFMSLTNQCLKRDPTLRPSAQQLMTHSFIKLCRKSPSTLPEIIATVTPRPGVCKSIDMEGLEASLPEAEAANCEKFVWTF